jgi:hypothetical protein
MTVAQVAARTSSTINNESDIPGGNEFEEGALFDETASTYEKLRSRTEKIITELLANNVRLALGSYTKINPWSTLASASSHGVDSQLAPTAELDSLLQVLRTLFGYLVRAFGTVPLRRIAKQTLQTIDGILTEQVILNHSFSDAGVAQFSADLNAIRAVVAKLIDTSMVETGLGRVGQATALLSLPIKSTRTSNDDDSEVKSGKVGLFEAEKRLYQQSDDARELLEELGLDQLSINDARKILARRIELSS